MVTQKQYSTSYKFGQGRSRRTCDATVDMLEGKGAEWCRRVRDKARSLADLRSNVMTSAHHGKRIGSF